VTDRSARRDGRLRAFTGGSGGAAKTVLAASVQAARELASHPEAVGITG
jgi:hypothetical protein